MKKCNAAALFESRVDSLSDLISQRTDDCNNCLGEFSAIVCVNVINYCVEYDLSPSSVITWETSNFLKQEYEFLDSCAALKPTEEKSTYCNGFIQEGIRRPVVELNRMCNFDIGSKLNLSNIFIANIVLTQLKREFGDNNLKIFKIVEEFVGDDESIIENEIMSSTRIRYATARTELFNRDTVTKTGIINQVTRNRANSQTSYRVWTVMTEGTRKARMTAIAIAVKKALRKFGRDEILPESATAESLGNGLFVVKIMKARK